MRIIGIILFSILFNSAIISQTEKASEINALNTYVEYLNSSIYALWLIHGELENFNMQLNNNFVCTNFSLNFTNNDFFGSNKIFKTPPNQLYENCLNESKELSFFIRMVFNRHLKDINDINYKLQLLCDSLESYSIQKQYLTDSNFEIAFTYLSNCALVFDLFYIESENLRELIMKNYEQQTKNISQNELLKSMLSIENLIVTCRNIFEATRKGNTPRANFFSHQLGVLLADFDTRKNAVINDFLKAENIDPIALQTTYNNVIFNAKDIYKQTESFKYNYFSIYFRKKGKDYYYYNSQYIDKYNSYGQGIIYNYNRMLEQSNVPMLKEIDYPNWFVVALPTINETDDYISDYQPDTTSLAGFSSNNLIFLLDVSGSMNEEEKLPLLKRAFVNLLTLMRPEDFVAIVTYSGRASIELKPTSAKKKDKIVKVINNLNSSGGSNVNRGLKLSYKLAAKNFINEGNNRIILATDGNFSINNEFYELLNKCVKNNIAITIIYLGKKENDKHTQKFKELATLGNGNYIHVTSRNANIALIKEAQSIRKN